jgi:beta-glucosidase
MAFLEGGAKAVMASYNAWNGTPMAVNPILKSFVRDQWGVDVLSTDGGAVQLLVDPRHTYPNQEAAVVACIKNGINQFLGGYKDEVKAALKDGSLTEADLDAVLHYKFQIAIKLGLLDPPDLVPYTKIKDEPEPWNTDRDRDVSREMALESVVLLKNENDFLPLDKAKIKSIAVIGPLADVVHWDWYGGTPPYTVTPLQAIRDEVGPNVKVNYAADDTQNGEADAIKAARQSDVAVVVVGNNPTCGDEAHEWVNTPDGGNTLPCSVGSDGREGRDRESINLEQEQLIKQIYYVNPKTVVMLIASFPYAINWTEANVPAILTMAQSAQDEGTALAKVLFGKYNPGGHLVETWPKSADQLPARMDYNIRDGYTYMYFKGEPLYPFGFGLSYTTFKFSNLKTASPRVAKAGTVQVTVDVTNTGSRAGDEARAAARGVGGVPAAEHRTGADEDGGDCAVGFAAGVLGSEIGPFPRGDGAGEPDGRGFFGGPAVEHDRARRVRAWRSCIEGPLDQAADHLPSLDALLGDLASTDENPRQSSNLRPHYRNRLDAALEQLRFVGVRKRSVGNYCPSSQRRCIS